jgi:hypothetical protein
VGDPSMRQIGSFMDPVQQSIGLRDVVVHHRWVGDQPVFSFRTIARRQQKGAMLARINMDVGTVDLYLTHLYFGTGLVWSRTSPEPNGRRTPSAKR